MLFGKKSSLYGRLVFLGLLLVPVFMWLGATGLAVHFKSSSEAVKIIAKSCALMGFVAYCLQPVLSMRFKLVEKLFGGLDSVYLLHKQSGKLAFYLICVHPVALAISSFLKGASLRTIWHWSSAMVLIGIAAFLALAVLTGIAIYAHIKHQQWVVVHRLFGWLMPVLVLHTLLANAQVTHITVLYIYMLLVAEIGFVSFLCRSVFTQFIRRYRYEVVEVQHLTPLVTELVLKPTGVPISYTPGQYAYVSFISSGIDAEPHPYSFTTGNNGPYIRFAIKNLGDDTANIKNITVGTLALLEGPHGSFSLYKSKQAMQVWIAGGVGITPFLAMARSLKPGDKHHIHLFYAADKLEDAVFTKELIAIRKTIPNNFEFTLVNKQWSGFVSAEVLGKSIKDLTSVDYLLCGPPTMTKALLNGLKNKGVKADHIFQKIFQLCKTHMLANLQK